MYRLLDPLLLLGLQTRFEGIRSGFRGRRFDMQDAVLALMVLAGVVLALWALSYFLKFQDKQTTFTSPTMLFWSLCRAHGLRWSDRWLLWRVARAARLAEPARLFLEPERFEPSQLRPTFRLHAARLGRLAEMLFVDPPPPPSETEPVEKKDAPADIKMPATQSAPTLDLTPKAPTTTGEEAADFMANLLNLSSDAPTDKT